MESNINTLKRVFICSPLQGSGSDDAECEKSRKDNEAFAKAACLFAVLKGCSPYAPHLYFPAFLNDDDPDEREIGIMHGLFWLQSCDEVWVIGRKISRGMEREICVAQELGIPVIRYVPERTKMDRFLDEIFYPGIDFQDMTL